MSFFQGEMWTSNITIRNERVRLLIEWIGNMYLFRDILDWKYPLLFVGYSAAGRQIWTTRDFFSLSDFVVAFWEAFSCGSCGAQIWNSYSHPRNDEGLIYNSQLKICVSWGSLNQIVNISIDLLQFAFGRFLFIFIGIFLPPSRTTTRIHLNAIEQIYFPIEYVHLNIYSIYLVSVLIGYVSHFSLNFSLVIIYKMAMNHLHVDSYSIWRAHQITSDLVGVCRVFEFRWKSIPLLPKWFRVGIPTKVCALCSRRYFVWQRSVLIVWGCHWILRRIWGWR